MMVERKRVSRAFWIMAILRNVLGVDLGGIHGGDSPF